MRTARILGLLCLVAGVVWTIGFPKSRDVLRPDTALSIALAVALLASGALLLWLPARTKSRWTLPLSLCLVWSVAANVWLGCEVRARIELLKGRIDSHGPR